MQIPKFIIASSEMRGKWLIWAKRKSSSALVFRRKPGNESDGRYVKGNAPLEIARVFFRITSNDVIHSFWVPEFRIKQDGVPGRWTTLRVTPTQNGDYRVRWAELCGYAHSAMYAPVVVVDPADFEAWLSGQAVTAQPTGELSPAEQGANLVKNTGCLGCHSTDGSKLVGPDWPGRPAGGSRQPRKSRANERVKPPWIAYPVSPVKASYSRWAWASGS